MADFADLEFGIHRWDKQWYSVDLRFLGPGDDQEERRQALTTIDVDALRALVNDPEAYGRALTRAVFDGENIRTMFREARVRAGDKPLRMRLFIGPTARELHDLRWETMLDPQDPSVWPAASNGHAAAAPPARAAFLATNQNVPFSRYMTSLNFRQVRPRSNDGLSVLAVIADPTDASQWSPDGQPLAKVDVEKELSVLRRLAEPTDGRKPQVRLTTLASGGQAGIKNLTDVLSRGEGEGRQGFDVLYLVAHGSFRAGGPVVYLEGESGKVDRVTGAEIAERIKDLPQLPRVVVLVSCQSAGDGGESRGSDTAGVLASLGPMLADAGVPAVVAMLGSVSMATMSEFLPVFLDVLQRDGQIDVAVAAGRGRVRDRPDSWMPVLFMRLRSGRVWFESGMDGPGTAFDKWDGLLSSIAKGRCTPVLGSGLVEALLGPTREIAARWADRYRYPMSPNDREDLPQVAQYLAVNQGNSFAGDELETYIRGELQRRFRTVLSAHADAARLLRPDADLDALISAIGADLRSKPGGEFEPHRVLASLPCPIYISTNYDRLMADALAEADAPGGAGKKDPAVGIFNWRDDVDPEGSVFADDPEFRPTRDRPLVYHLHGRFGVEPGIVLKEDDYFDYLIGFRLYREKVPKVVRRALTDSALLLLGYRLDDWDFRVLFRSINNLLGDGRRDDYKHVAAQIDPQADRIVDPELARRYLKEYFHVAQVSIYMGSAEAFLRELSEKWSKRAAAAAAPVTPGVP